MPKIKPISLMEIGSVGLNRFNGYIEEEFLLELKGTKGLEVYREMYNNDAFIGATVFAIEMLSRESTWEVVPYSNEDKHKKDAEFIEQCIDDMSHTWSDFISEIMTMLVYGFSVFEIVYKIRGGNSPFSESKSKYSDGKIGWRKFAIRSQETISRWIFDDTGGLQGIEQVSPPDYRTRIIPIEKLLLFRTSTHKNNPEGRSILRNAYRSWYFKKHIENIEAIGIERDLAGLPIAWIPSQLLKKSATAEEKATLDAIKKIVINIRRDEKEGVVFPLAYDSNGNKMFDLSLLSTGGRRQFDTSSIIDRYNRAIVTTVLADFLLLGTERGSYSLATEKTSIFSRAIDAWLSSIDDVINRYAITRLFEANNFPTNELPYIKHKAVEKIDIETVSRLIDSLTGAGAILFPNPELESQLMRQAGLSVSEE